MASARDKSSQKNTSSSPTGGARRYFKIPPIIDHQSGSFIVTRLRVLGGVVSVMLGIMLKGVISLVLWPRSIVRVGIVGTGLVAGAGVFLFLQDLGLPLDGALPASPEISGPENPPRQMLDPPEPDPVYEEETPSALRAERDALREDIEYTQRKLEAALAKIRANANENSATETNTPTMRQTSAADLLLMLGSGRPYQALILDVDLSELSASDAALLRRYSAVGFYDAPHLARRLTNLAGGLSKVNAVVPSSETTAQELPAPLAWLVANAGALVAVRPQATARFGEMQLDILIALFADDPTRALELVDGALAQQTVTSHATTRGLETTSALEAWRQDLAVWQKLQPVMARVQAAYAPPPKLD